jgi:hypothetical protein
VIVERVLQFGQSGDLVGILTQPREAPRNGRPIFVMWNVGVNHRVGPYRIYVDLCRDLAEAGFTALRFDSSGLGDSDVRREAVSDAEREDLDVRDALDMLAKRTGCDRFVLIGFCSSVDSAHRVAVKDPRVAGVVYVEGYAYQDSGFKRRALLRYLSVERWRRYITEPAYGWQRILRKLSTGKAPPAEEVVFQRSYPTWPAFRADLAGLARRGAQLLFVYSGGDTSFNHRDQFWVMFGTPELDRSKVEVSYYGRADHTFYAVGARNVVRERVVRWAGDRYPAVAADAPMPARSRPG